MYLSKLQNVFVQIVKCICQNWLGKEDALEGGGGQSAEAIYDPSLANFSPPLCFTISSIFLFIFSLSSYLLYHPFLYVIPTSTFIFYLIIYILKSSYNHILKRHLQRFFFKRALLRDAIPYQIVCFFFNIVQTGGGRGGSNPCSKFFVANFVHFGALFGAVIRKIIRNINVKKKNRRFGTGLRP